MRKICSEKLGFFKKLFSIINKQISIIIFKHNIEFKKDSKNIIKIYLKCPKNHENLFFLKPKKNKQEIKNLILLTI